VKVWTLCHLDPPPTESSALQLEARDTHSRYRRPLWLLPLLVLTIIGTAGAWLWAQQRGPQPQPRIQWSENEVEVILSPGESFSKELSFTSTVDVDDIVIERVPELAPFLTIQPKSFSHVPAGQPQSVTVEYSIPPGATLGDYEGTIHVRLGNRTLPETLKIVMNLWHRLAHPTLPISIAIPPEWNSEVHDDVMLFSSPSTTVRRAAPDEFHVPPDMRLEVIPNLERLNIDEFALQFTDGWFLTYGRSEPLLISGLPAFLLSDMDSEIGRAPALALFVAVADDTVILLAATGHAVDVTRETLDKFSGVIQSIILSD